MTQVPVIKFDQYGDDSNRDDLLLFAAPAKVLANWAGIPRKAWHIRMLFQRPISNSREADLKRFWNNASSAEKDGMVLGPTAIVLAIQGEPQIDNGQLVLDYQPIVDLEDDAVTIIPKLTSALYPQIKSRLSEEQLSIIKEFEAAPFSTAFPDIEHDYVYEFALQMAQMQSDVKQFVFRNEITPDQLTDIVLSMESLCRPALVVDGQHRLWGAANADRAVNLPVVAMPHCSWTDQIYQFVVINETAQKVETSLLTDIFGSSLTRREQDVVRQQLSSARVDVESRIAAVIATRDPASPFHNLVQLKIEGASPDNFKPYLSERTIRTLIDGSTRFSRGFRNDDDFYEYFVKPTIPVRDEWDSWSSGKWRDYWLAFWKTVKSFYNAQAAKTNNQALWKVDQQTNLTKAVTLREFQTLFIVKCVDRIKEIDATAEILKNVLGPEEATTKINELRASRALPADVEAFEGFVHDFFLERGVPIKVFQANWKSSLDDSQGQLELWETLESAWDRNSKGDRVVVRGGIFVARDPQDGQAKDG
ncbi:hypothetical protein [Rhizobium sp. WYCCWR 11128]|uniref:hypothetical protein n=1 Tax=Rhizobium sp. WYCCWR 11128 TaxID=2749832 RepID=UPI0015D3432B|nr:hypothetical protein [Rhizobium sp. WYCCWR 11128]NYT32057.1 hypothetical protein [Rhizobium sp. WYCCWR 11128]